MSPSAERVEEQIGRGLKSGDILRSGDKSFEVVKPNVPAGEGVISEGHHFDVPTVRVREMTPQGPGHATEDIPRDYETAWTGIVPKENRTDIPWWRKLIK